MKKSATASRTISDSSLQLKSKCPGLFATGRKLALPLMLAFAVSVFAENRVDERKVPPAYPMAAKAMHLEGIVKVTATISAAGSVTKAEAKGANRLLSDAAEDAVRKWKFAPAGSETTQDVEVIFKLTQ